MATTDGSARKASGHASDIAAAQCTSVGASMRTVSRSGRWSGAPPGRASNWAVTPARSRWPMSQAMAALRSRHAAPSRSAAPRRRSAASRRPTVRWGNSTSATSRTSSCSAKRSIGRTRVPTGRQWRAEVCAASLTRAGPGGDAVDRIAAALAGGDRRGLEGHAPLLGGERLERRAPGIDHAGEAHVVDDARALEVAGHRDEAALAEVEHGAVHVELSVGACREDDGEGARVEGVAMGFEAHRSESLRRGAPAQASPGIGPPIWLWRSPMKIAGAVALVTGGASGLGEATVAMVIENCGKAAILDRPGSAGEDVARRLGAQALFAAADVTSAEEVQAAVAKVVE